jgi:hypothetical protein
MGNCLKELEGTAYRLELPEESGIEAEKQLAGLRTDCGELTPIF